MNLDISEHDGDFQDKIECYDLARKGEGSEQRVHDWMLKMQGLRCRAEMDGQKEQVRGREILIDLRTSDRQARMGWAAGTFQSCSQDPGKQWEYIVC